MAVASMHLGVWSWSRRPPELQTECQNGKERWFKQFWEWHGCWYRRAGLSISQSDLSYWDFHTQPFLGFTKNGVKTEKTFLKNAFSTLLNQCHIELRWKGVKHSI